MPKNITLSLPDDLAAQMDKIPEVNWSAVAKACIKQYIEVRKSPDLSTLVEKLQKQKGEEYVNGRKKADALAETLGYRGLSAILKKYGRKMDEVNEIEMTGGPANPYETLPSPEEVIQTFLVEAKAVDSDVSESFLKGLRERLLEIDKVLSE